MPNPSNSQVLHEQNGHHPPSNSTELTPIPDDWSFATKELLDTLPQVWTRGILYFIVIFVAIIIPWAMIYEIEETGSAGGRLEPNRRTIKLESNVAGKITSVAFQEGDFVEAGQTILEIESDLPRSELEQFRSQLEARKNRLNLLKLQKNQSEVSLNTQQQQNQSQQLEKTAQVEQAKQNLYSLKSAFNLHKEEQLAQLNQAEQDIESMQASYEEINVNLLQAKAKVERHRTAYKAGALSRDQFEEEQTLVKTYSKQLERAESDIEKARSRSQELKGSNQRILHQLQADIEQAELRLKEQEKSYDTLLHSGKLGIQRIKEQLNNLDSEISNLESEIEQTKSQIESKEIQLEERIFKASQSGVIFGLPDKGIGAVIQPGELIAEIAPEGSTLLLKAQIPTSESGSLAEGMEAKVKFDAYPFQDYGLINGTVVRKSPTSKVVETAQEQVAIFEVDIELEKACMPTKTECKPLKPGDTAIAEVITDKRKVIDYIIDPFKKLQKGGLEL